MKELTTLIKQLPNTRLIVIGDLMLDVFIYGSVDRISPEAPVPVVKVVKERAMPGGAANVAANLASLGSKPTLIGVASNDNDGKHLKKILRSMDIDTMYFDDGRNTSVKTRIIAHNQQVVRFDKEKNDKLSKNFSSDIIDYVTGIIDRYDGIILSDYGKGVITEFLIKKLTLLCREKNKIITVDPKVENFKLYKNVTSITPNNKEASQATGIPIHDEKSLLNCGNRIIEMLQCNSVLITRGAEGMSLFMKNEETKNIPAVAKEVFDVTGAGDTVISVFSAAISLGATLKEAAFLANAAAGIVVGKVGTATVSLEELENNLPYSVNVMGVE